MHDVLSPERDLFRVTWPFYILWNKWQYLGNNARWRYRCNERLIRNIMWPIEWHYCRWPLVTLKVTFANTRSVCVIRTTVGQGFNWNSASRGSLGDIFQNVQYLFIFIVLQDWLEDTQRKRTHTSTQPESNWVLQINLLVYENYAVAPSMRRSLSKIS